MSKDYQMITLKSYLDQYVNEDSKKIEETLVKYQSNGRSERNEELLKSLLD